MSYLVIGAGLALAGFVAADLVATAWAAAAFGLVEERAARWSPSRRAWLLTAVRVLPGLAALAFAAAVVVPGYARLEPRGGGESAGAALATSALLGVALLARGPLRAVSAWRTTRRLESEWMRAADRVPLDGVGFPAWRVRGGADGIWMAGLLRPRLIVGGAVLDTLTPAELAVALRHEAAHAAGHDNLVRLFLAAAPGALSLLPLGRRLERLWTHAAESAADRRAAAGAPDHAIDLASALLKVARLRPRPVLLAATALDEGDVGARVHQLLDAAPAPVPSRAAGAAAWAALLAPIAAVAALAASPSAIALIHSMGELLVRR